MRGTQLVRRATQTLRDEDAARIVAAAAQRASANASAKKPSWVRRNVDLIVIGAATFVAGTALKNRREHEERFALLEAELNQVKLERDHALTMVESIKNVLVEDAASAVKAVDGAASGRSARSAAARTAKLQEWIREGIDKMLVQEEKKQDAAERPTII